MTTIQESASKAVATRDDSPRGLIDQYANDFKMVMPSHVRPETWLRLAQGALKKGKKVQGGKTELEIAAANNPGVFLAAVMEAARLGLEPGTNEFYLTPRKVKGQLEILGIVGYQGHIELMYRAGAVSSVVAECVYSNDRFDYQPGRDEKPVHVIDWDAEDRGSLRLVYAYAPMRGGATSKVVVLNKADINRIKRSAQGANSDYSPWVTNEPAMWLKSAVRQLQKWVPTSAEYRSELRADMADAQRARVEAERPQYRGEPLPDVDVETGELYDEEVIDGEIVDGDYDPTTEPSLGGAA